MQRSRLVVRAPTPADGAAMWRLVHELGGLEINSPYAYVLIGDHFAATSRVAVTDDSLAGFVAAYRPPTHPDTVFVWQIGVHPDWQGRGVGRRLLEAAADGAGDAVRYLEATVTPSNVASERTFRAFAAARGVRVEVADGYPAALFPDDRAEPERLFRIGPWSVDARS